MGEYTNLFAKIQQEAKLDMDLTDLVPFGTEGSGNQIKIATIMQEIIRQNNGRLSLDQVG